MLDTKKQITKDLRGSCGTLGETVPINFNGMVSRKGATFRIAAGTPADTSALATPRKWELLYCLLQSPHGALLRQLIQCEGHLVQVRRAIDWIRRHFDEPLTIKTLAEIADMSVPSLN